MKQLFLLAIALLSTMKANLFSVPLLFLIPLTVFAETESAKPNIIIVMPDDLAYGDYGCLGNPILQTPSVDAFMKESLLFTNFHVSPTCAPTRAAMLSGQYPARIHNDVYVVGNLNRNGRGGISKRMAKFLGPKQSEDVAVEAVTEDRTSWLAFTATPVDAEAAAPGA